MRLTTVRRIFNAIQHELLWILRVNMFSIAAVGIISLPAQAATEAETGVYPFDYATNQVLYYEPCGPPSKSPAVLGSIYVLGDDITSTAKTSITSSLKNSGYTSVEVNGINRQTVADAPAKLDAAKDKLKDVQAIIIQLGTYGGADESSISKVADKLKELSPKASYYWVDTYASNNPIPYAGASGLAKTNLAIRDTASKKGYKLMSWAQAVDTSLDPTNESQMTKTADPKDMINETATPGTPVIPSASGIARLGNLMASSTTNLSSSTQQGVSGNAGTSGTATNPNQANVTKNEPSIEQKIAKTFIVGFDVGGGPAQPLAMIDKYKLGGLFMTGQGAGTVFNKQFFDQAREKSLGSFIATADEEGGVVDRYDIGTPAAADLGNAPNDDVTAAGEQIGKTLSENGVYVDLAPVVDLGAREPGNHLNGGRAFGTDAARTKAKARAFTEGLNKGGITGVYKHFPGIGSVSGNSDQTAVTTTYDPNNPAASVFKDLPTGTVVMLSNAYISNQDNIPAPNNKKLIDSLKSDLNYQDVVMTDDLTALTHYNSKSLEQTIVDSFNSGVDTPLFKFTDEGQLGRIISAVKQGVPTDRITDAYNKALELANRKGFFEESKSNSCCPDSSGGGSLAGNNNAAKAFNFLVGKKLTPEQAAGVVGNMILESGVAPQRLQNTPLATKTPADQAENNSNGWGIVQWTPAGKMITPTKKSGKNANQLTIQLEFLWGQLSDPKSPSPETGAGEDLKKQTTSDSATQSFHDKYERSSHSESVPQRQTYAKAILDASKGKPLPKEIEASISTDDGGGSPSATAASSSPGETSSCSQGVSTGEYKDPFRDLTQSEDVSKRVDGGIDQGNSTDKGKPIYAIGPAKITGVWPDSGSSGWPGVPGSYIKYEFTAGSLKGKSVYITEDCTPKVKEGDTVDANKEICTYTYADSWLELGFAEGGKQSGSGYVSWSDYNAGGGGSYASNSGLYMDKFIKKLGGKGGQIQGPTSTKPVPGDWPKF